MSRIANNNNGFTLIETVISLGILSIGILALFAMQTLGIRANANANRVTTLATWEGDEIEQEILTETYKHASQRTQDTLDYAYDPNNYTIKRTYTTDSPVKNVMTIDVTMTNKQDGKKATLRYLKANEGSL